LRGFRRSDPVASFFVFAALFLSDCGNFFFVRGNSSFLYSLSNFAPFSRKAFKYQIPLLVRCLPSETLVPRPVPSSLTFRTPPVLRWLPHSHVDPALLSSSFSIFQFFLPEAPVLTVPYFFDTPPLRGPLFFLRVLPVYEHTARGVPLFWLSPRVPPPSCVSPTLDVPHLRSIFFLDPFSFRYLFSASPRVAQALVLCD